MAPSDNKTTIVVAVIALISALGVAVITNYDKLFTRQVAKTPPSTATTTQDPTASGKTLPPKPKPPKTFYKRMDFGFDNCDVHFGELKTGVSEADMIRMATTDGAEGFTYHPSLKYGKLIIGDYPKGCKSSPQMSWPLYLRSIE